MVKGTQSLWGEPMADENKDKFYDVERFRLLLETQGLRPRGGPLRLFLRRMLFLLDSVSGLFSAFLGLPIFLMSIFVVFVGVLYGPWMFLATAGGTFGLFAFYVNRKVGKSLQFGDYSLSRRTLAQIVGFALALGLLLFLISLPTIFQSL